MTDIIIIAIVAVIVGLAAGYVRKARKNGVKCIGCPAGSKCPGNCSGCSGCNSHQ